MSILPNTQDFLFQMGANGDDPIVRYAMVGSTVEEGLYSWIRFGIDTSADMPVNPAAFWREDGGEMNPTGPISQIVGGGLGGGFGGFPGGGGGGGFPGMPGMPAMPGMPGVGRLLRRLFGRGGE